jgi:hypothetical protein
MVGPQVNVGELMSRVATGSSTGFSSSFQRRAEQPDPYTSVMDDDELDGDKNKLPAGTGPSTPFTAFSSSGYKVSPIPSSADMMRSADLGATTEDTAVLMNAVDMLAAATISPIVQERLFRAIFNHYVKDAGNNSQQVPVMNLTRFGRFTKEYGIVAPANSPARANNQSGVFLVSGEADIVFKNCIKLPISSTDLLTDVDDSGFLAQQQSPRTNNKPFVVPKGHKSIINRSSGNGTKQQNIPLVAKLVKYY